MSQLFAGIHIPNKPRDFLELKNINFGNTVLYLKDEIATNGALECKGNNLEIVYNGIPLKDDDTLEAVLQPDAVVHCFMKTNKYQPYTPPANITSAENLERVQELFNVIAHIQINVSSRVNILQRIVNEYPEFRRNLGAQALIRDSVLFNTLHTPEVVRNAAKTYPIIIEAASFIVDTVKKELTRTASLQRTPASEAATDSTNSSEDDSSTERTSGASTRSADNADGRRPNEPPNAGVRSITHQQLRAALANINSVNNFGNLPAVQGPATVPTANAGQGPIAADTFNMLRDIMHRMGGNGAGVSNTPSSSSLTAQSPNNETTPPQAQDPDMDSGDIPLSYRTHQYADQLRTMAQMGFTNWEENLQYLNLTNGNIENAVNLIMAVLN